jgi:hypothetical protein
MAIHHVPRLLERMRSDAALAAELARLPPDGGAQALVQLLRVAAAAGLPFTETELESLLRGLPQRGSGELSDLALDQVSGGASADSATTLQQTQLSFNAQYLHLESAMQHENRSYAAISNIMKTKHDTVKNSISNVR